MFKIKLSFLIILFSTLSLFSQTFQINPESLYKMKKLSFDEANILTSYYHQEGNHSAITGGIGTEKLSDFANVFNVKFHQYNGKGGKHSYGAEFGIDYYSSASSDKIDHIVSSASSSDTRFYPSLQYTFDNEKTGWGLGGNIAFSQEYDYNSIGSGFSLLKTSKNKNTEFNLKANVFFDTYLQIVPTEFRSTLSPNDIQKGVIGNASRNSMDLSLGISQILNSRLQVSFNLDLAYQSGLLSTPFHRVYFLDGSLQRENLPSTRFKIPMSLRANYFMGQRIIFRTFYRFFKDDWGLSSHTAQIETSFKLNPLISITPFYRYYGQQGIDFFAPMNEHVPGIEFYTSDYDLSTFNSHFYGAGIRIVPGFAFLKYFAVQQIEMRGGLYQRSDGLRSGIISLHLQIKGI